MIRKIPGFFFSSYRQIAYAGSIITSNQDYWRILEDQFEDDEAVKANYLELIGSYNFTYGVPKDFLFVRLKQGLPLYRREYIANGIRSFLRDDLSVVFDLEDLKASVQSSLDLFSLFSVIVGIIALILAFFLLLTSTSANIKENFWELGVLKAMGLSKSQCQSMLLYEAFCTVGAALILGIGIGLLIAFTLTAQFYLFLELTVVLAVRLSFLTPIVPNNSLRFNDSTFPCHDPCCCFDPCQDRS
jgi:ABC-type antimicrobial peptide transport system permease subunit